MRIISSARLMGIPAWTIAFLGVFPLMAGAELRIDWFTMDSGGWTFSSAGSFSLGGTVGQPDPGTCSGQRLDLFGGFWRGGEQVPTAVGDPEDPVGPSAEVIPFHLIAGVPNPFAGETSIVLGIPDRRPVEVAVFDPRGRLVRSLCDQEMPSGRYRFRWDGRGKDGHTVASGLYLVRVRAGGDEARARVVLLR